MKKLFIWICNVVKILLGLSNKTKDDKTSNQNTNKINISVNIADIPKENSKSHISHPPKINKDKKSRKEAEVDVYEIIDDLKKAPKDHEYKKMNSSLAAEKDFLYKLRFNSPANDKISMYYVRKNQ